MEKIEKGKKPGGILESFNELSTRLRLTSRATAVWIQQLVNVKSRALLMAPERMLWTGPSPHPGCCLVNLRV